MSDPETKTPRCDAAEFQSMHSHERDGVVTAEWDCVPIDFARELERALAASEERVAQLRDHGRQASARHADESEAVRLLRKLYAKVDSLLYDKEISDFLAALGADKGTNAAQGQVNVGEERATGASQQPDYNPAAAPDAARGAP